MDDEQGLSPYQELTVGEIAARSGVAVSTVHFYEAKGLIKGSRTKGNQRRYPRAMLRRIAIIRVAQRAGIPLAEIKTAMDMIPNNRAPSVREWEIFTRSWSSMLRARIDSLSQLHDQITKCIGCGCLSLRDCPLRNPQDSLARKGAGPLLLQNGDG